MDAFSSNAEDVLHRVIDVMDHASVDKRPPDVHNYLEIERCQDFVVKNNFKKVALQFPDDLLWSSAQVVSFLSNNTSAKYFILGDTSYGSCCVDEIAAQHAEADCVIHFGQSCLSPTTRLPVLHIFGRQYVDTIDLVNKFQELFKAATQPVLVLYDVIYAHIADEIQIRLKSINSNTFMSSIGRSSRNFSLETSTTAPNNSLSETEESCPTENKNAFTTHRISGRQLRLTNSHKLEDCSVFYIGNESLTLTNLMMSLNKCPFYTYNPETRSSQRESLNMNKMLMKRYYMIERAKDAEIVGIIIGTLGVAKYMDILKHLKSIMKKAGKKYYTFAVGKLNVAKLANFMEVQLYVLVACQENTLIDSKEFYQPVVTPYEMEIACNQAREWTGEYVTDFSDLLPGAAQHIAMPESVARETDVSLITGRLRSIGTSDDSNIDSNNRALVTRDETLAVVEHNTAGDFLSQRSWQGLQADLGQTDVAEVIEGTHGIAASYSHEEGTPV